MSSLHEQMENLLFAIDHLSDAADYCEAAGEANTADILRDMIGELSGVVSTIMAQVYQHDEAERKNLCREYEKDSA